MIKINYYKTDTINLNYLVSIKKNIMCFMVSLFPLHSKIIITQLQVHNFAQAWLAKILSFKIRLNLSCLSYPTNSID